MTTTNDTRTYRADATGTVITGVCKVTSIRWVGATTAGHTAVIHDGGGFEKFKMQASGSNFEEESGVERLFDGIVVNTLASGVLWFEVEQLGV